MCICMPSMKYVCVLVQKLWPMLKLGTNQPTDRQTDRPTDRTTYRLGDLKIVQAAAGKYLCEVKWF